MIGLNRLHLGLIQALPKMKVKKELRQNPAKPLIYWDIFHNVSSFKIMIGLNRLHRVLPGPGKAVDLLLWTIWLVTDAFMLLTVHGIINLSLMCFPLQLYVTAGKNVG